MQTSLKIGEFAPDFELPAATGERVHLYGTLERSPVVLFVLVKAFTPVCTVEACVPKTLGLFAGRATFVIGQDRRIKQTIGAQFRAQQHIRASLEALGALV